VDLSRIPLPRSESDAEACRSRRVRPQLANVQFDHAKVPWRAPTQSLIVDLLERIGPAPRPYAEDQDAWRTSCPKLPVWEDAVDTKFLDSWFEVGRGRLVAVSASGVELLRSHGRAEAFR
jgi:D-3-phosphoglycerate dehydrogenase